MKFVVKITLSIVVMMVFSMEQISSAAVPVLSDVEPISRAACPQNYSPCTCDQDSTGLNIDCNQVPLTDVKNIFTSTTPTRIYSVTLLLSPSNDGNELPADLFATNLVKRINLNCPTPSHRLAINNGAFRSSTDYTNWFSIGHCSLQLTNFAFLNGFLQLNNLLLIGSSNVESLQTLPALPMQKLAIQNCTGVTALDFSTLPLPNLGSLSLPQNELDDQMTSALLTSLASSPFVSTLTILDLKTNKLTEIPESLGSILPQVYLVTLNKNQITTVKSNSLSFLPRRIHQMILDLSRNSISTVEPGAFQGGFAGAYVNFSSNSLTRLESSAFLPLFQDMSSEQGMNKLGIYGSPIDCEVDLCHLAWLIRDNRQYLDMIRYGACSNFTALVELDPNAFNGCP